MKDQTNELKPCPFCGNEAAIWDAYFPGKARDVHALVGCELCKIFCVDQSEENAIAEWNRRANDE